MKAKLRIIIPAAIAVIAVIIAIIFIKLPEAGTVDTDSLMSTAQKYLIELDYEQAIAEFEKIIELEPNNVEAYLGLAQAYRDSGDIDKAVEVLEKGYEITGDERLRSMLEELTGRAVSEEETIITTVPETETETEVTTTEEVPLMPDLVGMTMGEAASACSSMGIEFTVQTVENSYVDAGYVMGQSVLADSVIDDDTAVTIMVSGGIQTTTEPVTYTTTTFAETTAAPVTTTAPVTTAEPQKTTAKPVTTTEKKVEYITIKGEKYSTELDYLWLFDRRPKITDNDIKDLDKMVNLTVLCLGWSDISDISALKGLINLRELYLDNCRISNITSLEGLTNLTCLGLYDNKIEDITPLRNLINMTELDLSYNQISDITPLKNLTSLTELDLSSNEINDISSLKNLTNLTELDLSSNEINDISSLK
ncbi:MAG: leucine-rich repeat domain-containing protein, partial [Oscillospiraceae bacterium]